jgi:hypothetical protein
MGEVMGRKIGLGGNSGVFLRMVKKKITWSAMINRRWEEYI